MSEIQSLTERAESLSQSVDWWNTALIWALVFGAIAAIALVVTTRIGITRAKQLSDVQAELIGAKDRQLAIDLRDKDKKIAEADARAVEAQLELARLTAPRTLSVEQQNRIGEKLKAFHGTTFEVVTYPGEPESVAFSQVIANTLVRAGWALNSDQGHGFLLGLASGVVVVVGKQAGPQAEQAGTTLVESLISEGVAAKLGSASIVTMIKIQVAKKP